MDRGDALCAFWAFDEDVGAWDTARVTTFRRTFREAKACVEIKSSTRLQCARN